MLIRINIALCALTVAAAQTQPPCCVQPAVTGGNANVCTTVAWCNADQANCLGDCEGSWVTSFGQCVAGGETCSPTAPVQCCAPFSCINAVNNVGTCGTSAPTTPTTPAPAPPTGSPPAGPPSGSRATYYFGHSLIYHTWTDYPNVNLLAVPYWMNQFATAEQDMWLANGAFRFANYVLPPFDQWQWTPDISAWQGSYAASNFNSIVYTELNFVQYQAPNLPYGGDNPEQTTPIDSLVRIIDFINDPNMPIYVYECWNGADSLMPDYYPFLGENIIPTTAQRDEYYARSDRNSAYHQWWLDLMQFVLNERPGANIQLIEISPILIDILRSPPLANVPFDAIFEDNAPHGRPSAYFLAALIQYIGITGERPNAAYSPPNDGSLVPEIVNNYDAIMDLIAAALNVAPTTPAPVGTPAPMAPTMATPQPQATATPAPMTQVTPAPAAPPTTASMCCFQPEIVADGCTSVDWCNMQQANCEGDCEGSWVPTTSFQGTPSPVTPATPAPMSQVTPAPMSQGTPAPVPPPTAASMCCFQPEIVADDCTSVDWCNMLQANCEGDCEGSWVLTTSFAAPQATPAPMAAATPAPAPASGEMCCFQEEIFATGCTTIDWCNAQQQNCEGDCEGQWIPVPSRMLRRRQ